MRRNKIFSAIVGGGFALLMFFFDKIQIPVFLPGGELVNGIIAGLVIAFIFLGVLFFFLKLARFRIHRLSALVGFFVTAASLIIIMIAGP